MSRIMSSHADFWEQKRWEEPWFGDRVMREEEEDARAYDKLKIPPKSLGWTQDSKFFGLREKHPHGWRAHPRRAVSGWLSGASLKPEK